MPPTPGSGRNFRRPGPAETVPELDILEDCALKLYTEGLGDFTLPLSYFHYDAIPDLNYVIATPAGGKRDYTGAWLTFRKRRTPEDCFLRMTCRRLSHKSDDLQGLPSGAFFSMRCRLR